MARKGVLDWWTVCSSSVGVCALCVLCGQIRVSKQARRLFRPPAVNPHHPETAGTAVSPPRRRSVASLCCVVFPPTNAQLPRCAHASRHTSRDGDIYCIYHLCACMYIQGCKRLKVERRNARSHGEYGMVGVVHGLYLDIFRDKGEGKRSGPMGNMVRCVFAHGLTLDFFRDRSIDRCSDAAARFVSSPRSPHLMSTHVL